MYQKEQEVLAYKAKNNTSYPEARKEIESRYIEPTTNMSKVVAPPPEINPVRTITHGNNIDNKKIQNEPRTQPMENPLRPSRMDTSSPDRSRRSLSRKRIRDSPEEKSNKRNPTATTNNYSIKINMPTELPNPPGGPKPQQEKAGKKNPQVKQ